MVGPAADMPRVTGKVVVAGTDDPVTGATVSVGAVTTTTGPDGLFSLTGLTPGPASLQCIAPGYAEFQEEITVPSGSIARDITLTPLDPSTPLSIQAFVSARLQWIYVWQAGEHVPDARVTVNDVVIPRGTIGGTSPAQGVYRGAVPEALAPGMPLVLKVEARGMTVEARGNVPESPVLTAPSIGTVFTAANPITIAWTSSTDPDHFEVGIGFRSAFPEFFTTPGTARDLIAPGYEGVMDSDEIRVRAFNEGSFTGPVEADSQVIFYDRLFPWSQ